MSAFRVKVSGNSTKAFAVGDRVKKIHTDTVGTIKELHLQSGNLEQVSVLWDGSKARVVISPRFLVLSNE